MSEAVNPVPKFKFFVQWGLIVALAVLVAIAALPNYLSGQWPWQAPLDVPHLSELRNLMPSPLTLEGWQLEQHQEIRLGGNRWSFAQYRVAAGAEAVAESEFALLLRPQTDRDKQPEVEWVDLQGIQRWQVSDRHTVRFDVTDETGQPIPVTSRYLRAIDGSTTLAVMQWYAWPTGGHFAPGRWFWVDQRRQWRQHERLPWVAVSILLPIEPVGDIRPHTEAMVAIAQHVQHSLLTGPFASP